MGVTLVAPRAAVVPLTLPERTLLADLASSGAALLRRGVAERPAACERAGRVLFRRWALEALIVLDAGPQGFNDLRRALGRVAGESLAPKLRALVDAGLATREALPGRPARVRYALSDTGGDVAACLLALTHAKAEHLGLLPGGGPPFGAPAPEAPSLDAAAARHVRLARAFRGTRVTVAGAGAFATARRLTGACTRRWHGAVLERLAEGPRRFAEIRAEVGAGDEALARALAHLQAIGSVERIPGRRYAITPLGLRDLALGGAAVVVLAVALQPS